MRSKNSPARLGTGLRQLLATSLLCLAGASSHAAYTNITVFGDSLSDTGNVLSLTTALAIPPFPFPNFPAAPGRFSNGPVWVEHLAAGLGRPGDAAPANLLFNGAAVIPIGAPGGSNYAYGGARTGLGGFAGPTSGLLGQLINWNGGLFATSLTRVADPNALYVVVAGGNDLRDARSANPGNTPAEAAARAAAAATAAQGVGTALGLLAQAGARNFLVANLPDLGGSPEAVANNVVAASTDVTLAFNAALAATVAGLDAGFLGLTGIDLNFAWLDFYGLNAAVINDANTNGGGVFGITQVTTPCMTPVVPGAYFAPGSSDAGCTAALFSDDLHPAARSHALVGRAALNALGVSEPPVVALLAVALLALGARGRRRALIAA
jgi:phospholipase/lecithinase/hemolysin